MVERTMRRECVKRTVRREYNGHSSKNQLYYEVKTAKLFFVGCPQQKMTNVKLPTSKRTKNTTPWWKKLSISVYDT
jgi:hypothetical protein